ncbi:ORAI2 [Cordylochernes scorpioides]|uniref:ORAI2 n=1 Tax=Cordylochernes scorpioides TaxID=51811 RepID=A0ABY6LCR0_9ARAC|nr:ORAI2 [Cordylochernes scorpioides]
MLQWPPILAKVQPHQRVQVTKRGSGTFVAMVEIQLSKDIPPWLLIAFSVCTTLLVSVHMLALMISTCILPNLEAVSANLQCPPALATISDSPHDKMHRYIETAWAFSTLFGILLFIVEIAILSWVKFYDFSIPAAEGRHHHPVDKSIELKQINSTLSRMEGIKPPAEFVPYSNEKKWETWRESFEIFAIAVNLESMPLVRQRAILKHIAGEKTVMIYKTVHISENDTYPNVKEMLDMLTNHFKPFKNTIQRRNAFFTCVQKEKQGIMEFVTELKRMLN